MYRVHWKCLLVLIVLQTFVQSITSCPANQMLCYDKIHCATACDNVTDCEGGEDEHSCIQLCADCEDGQLLCHDMIHCATQCNHNVECPGGEDELNCTKPCANCTEGQSLCNDETHCAFYCNDIPECSGGEDESNCPDPCDDSECEDMYALIYQCDEYTDKWIVMPDHVIDHHGTGASALVTSKEECGDHCKNTTGCRSANYFPGSLNDVCTPNNITIGEAFSNKMIRYEENNFILVQKCSKCPNFISVK